MPRPRRPGAPEPKRRSRKGCWPCKARKVKCGEEKPSCLNCRRQNEKCDYSVRLNWGGRTRRRSSVDSPSSQSSGGQSGQFFFALSPSDMNPDSIDINQSLHSPGAWESANLPEPDNLLLDIGLTREMAMGTSHPRGLHDIQESPAVHDQPPSNSNCTSDETVELQPSLQGQDDTTPWPSVGIPLSGETVQDYSSIISQSLDAIPYPSPGDTGPSIGSTATASFSPTTVSRPISYIRHSADFSHQYTHSSPSERNNMPENFNNHRHYSSSTDAASACSGFDTQSPNNVHETVSPYSSNLEILSSPGVTQTVAPLPADATSSNNSFIPRALSGPLTSDNDSYDQCREVGNSSFDRCMGHDPTAPAVHTSTSERKWQTYLTNVTDNYGLDCGRPDLDLNQNDDHSAIDINYALTLLHPRGELVHACGPESPTEEPAKQSSLDFTNQAYYVSPVPINIPRYLSPLPSSLVQTPINLMYFHHFINHTARVLVPHDCGNNPFVSVLPSMAIGDSNLLNLTLAYSASHRARYLEHPEPTNRIAHWVSNVFPALRVALEDPHENVTDNHLAAAIMLLSLKIISPSTFEVPIPWQSHLKLARDLFMARKVHMAYPGNRVGAFLTRWLGYLDTMGTLSCRHSEPPLLDYYSLLSTCCVGEQYDDFCVDCFTGFTPRTGLLLMRLGKLVHKCDNEQFDERGNFLTEWKPSAETVLEGEALLAELDILDVHVHADGAHFHDSKSTDIIAMDQAFRYAGLVHLHRRVLGVSSASASVKEALDKLMEALVLIRSGSSAEVGAMFALFTAGCETNDSRQRSNIKERFEELESTGMKQIQNARTLMQRCWSDGLPWIALAQGEFLG